MATFSAPIQLSPFPGHDSQKLFHGGHVFQSAKMPSTFLK
jgi:hypothetical protein